MGTGDYICVTLQGDAPWGFTLEEGEGDTYTPFLVSKVEDGGCAFLAGLQDGDEVVSINGEPCANLTLLRASALIDTSIDCLQLLLKRNYFISPEDCESEETCYGETASSGKALETTTLHIFSPKNRSQTPGEVSKSASPGRELVFKKDDEEIQRCLSPGNMVELQVSLSEQTLGDVGCASLGCARGIEGELSNRETVQTVLTTTASQCMPCPVRQPLSQHGVVVSSSSMLEVIFQQPGASGVGRGLSVGGPRVNESAGSQSEGEEGGGRCEGASGSFTISFEIPSEGVTPGQEQDSDSDGDQDKPNKHRAKHARLRRNESLSEKQVKEAKSKCKRIALLLTAAPLNPNNKGVLMFKKHRQRAKKYTLVSYGTGEDEPEYSNSEDEDNEDKKEETQVGEFTFAASINSESDKSLPTNDPSCKDVLTFILDKGLLETERNLNNKAEMEGKGATMFAQRRQRMDEISAEHDELRRQGLPVEGQKETDKRIMEHSYMQSNMEGHAYMDVNMHEQNQQQYQQYQEQQYYGQQQNYQQQQQYQQYQQQQQQQQYEQRQYQQQQMYQQQQDYHQEQQQIQHYSTNINGMVQQQANEIQSSFNNRTAKPFTAENIAAPPYSSAASGTNQDAVGQGEQIASRDERISTPAIKTGILLDSKKRSTGKPMFTFKEAPKVSPNPALLNLLNRSDKKGFESGPEEDYLSLGAEACNFLQSQRVKPKIPPPVAPKPVINPSSPPWSPQMEVANQDMPQCAENSLSTPAVAPAAETAPAPELEPILAPAPEPSTPPAPHETAMNTNTAEQHAWTPQEAESQQQPLQVISQEANVQMSSSMQLESSHVSTWGAAQTQAQQQVSSSSWHQAQLQPQEPLPSQSPPQPPWATRLHNQNQAQPQAPTNNWTPQTQTSWTQPHEQAQTQRHGQSPWVQPQEQPQVPPQVHAPWAQPQEQPQTQAQVQPPWAQPQEQPQTQAQVQPPWAQPQEQPQAEAQVQPPWAHPQEQPQAQAQVQPPWAQPQEQPQAQAQAQAQVQPPWAHSNEQQHLQQTQPSWGQSQEPVQIQPQNQWTQQSQIDSQQQPPWMQQPQKKSQVQPPWVQQGHPEPQPQPPWAQPPQHQAVQQSWSQSQAPGQPQPPWVSAQPQQQPTPNAWAPPQTQAQAQPPWIHASQPQPQVEPQANLNPWAPVPVQAQSQPSWSQPPQEPGQHQISSWPPEQNQAQIQAQHQPPWPQSVPPQPPPQTNWQQPTSNTPPQAQMNTWPPAQAQPQTPVSAWTPQSQQTPVNVSTSTVNTRPSPKPWQGQQTAPQNQTPPPPPRRMHSFTVDQRTSSPINPMASVLNPKSLPGPAFEMSIVRGKGADMFAKRQSRMEKFVVDSETVEANKASRSTSPVASLPNEWKYTPNVRAPPSRAYNPIQSPSYPPAASKQPVPSSPSIKAKKKDQEKPKPAPKPLNVIDVMKHQPYQLDSSLFIFGPGAEAVKPPAPKPSCSPPNPPTDNQPIRYEQMAPVQQPGPFAAPYPQQAYGMPMQPVMHDGHYQQTQANVYPYQQPPGGPYQQEYNQQYHQPAPPAYHPQAPQPLNPPYQQAIQAAYQPANSPPYLATPSVPYEPRPTSTYIAPSFPVAARPESTSGSSSVAAPKPRFTANKSSAQVWKPAVAEKE